MGVTVYVNAKGVELKATSSGNQSTTTSGSVRTGTSKADILNSVAGSTLKGGLGDDVYYLWDSTSTIVENADEGSDTIYVKYWGTLKMAANVENAVASSPGVNGITGNSLDNLIIGGAMRATLDGGAGADVLVGGAGADIFKVTAGNGSDVIYDFTPGWDTVKLNGYAFTSFAQLKAAATQNGADVVVQLSGSETLTLRDVQLKDLGAADFALPLTKPAAPSGATVLNGVGQLAIANGWYAFTNAWGANGLAAGTDYNVQGFASKADMTKGTTFYWSFPQNTDSGQTVKAFPEVIFGVSPLNSSHSNPGDTKMVLPAKVGDLVGLTAAYDVSIAGNTGGFNVAYDIWLTNKAYGDRTTVTNEVMIWVHKGDYEAWGTLVGTYAKGDFTAKIYHSGTYTAIVADKDVLAGTIDVGDILNKLKALGYVSDSDYVGSIELGSEVSQGQGQLTINNLDITVSTKTANGIVTKVASGDGATVTTTPTTPANPPPPTGGAPLAYYKAGVETLTDDHGVVLGQKVTTLSGSTATVVFTDTVGKSLGRDVATLSTTTATVQHYDGAGKLIGSDKQTFAADGAVTTNRYTGTGAAIETLKEYTTSGGVQVTEHYDTRMTLVAVDKTTTSASGDLSIQRLDGNGGLLGVEAVSAATDGTITVRYSNGFWQLTAVDVIKVANGATTTSHFDGKGGYLGQDISRTDDLGVIKTNAYSGNGKVIDTSYFGTDRADTLTGGSGVTHFYGGLGSDKMTGGSGVDYFHLDSLISQGDVDVIASFNTATDRIVFDRSIFAEAGAEGALSKTAFVAGTKALDAADRVIFDKATGQLWYDDDGTGAHAPVLLAKIGADAELNAGHFLIS